MPGRNVAEGALAAAEVVTQRGPRRAVDRAIGLVARALVACFFRRIELVGRARIPDDRPVLIVANHFNGFVDPLVIAALLRRLPRFIAKASLRKVVPARPFLGLVGVVLVGRRQDEGGTAGNERAFEACYEALRRRDVVAIFPEGTTHDRPRMVELRTGAARIALGALADGAAGLVVLPVGLTFPDKLSLRSSVLARVGEPLDLDNELHRFVRPGEVEDETNTTAVRALTAELDRRLRVVAPDFDDAEEWLALEYAAEVALRTRKVPEPRLVERARLAHRLGRAPEDAQQAVRAALGRYHLTLSFARLHDRDVAAAVTVQHLLWSVGLTAAAAFLLAPIVAAGVTVNLLPFLAVAAAGQLVMSPVSKGTVRTLVAVVAFPVAWYVAALPIVEEWWLRVLVAIGYGIAGYIALILAEYVILAVRRAVAWRTRQEARARLADLATRRAEVIAAVESADSEARTLARGIRDPGHAP